MQWVILRRVIHAPNCRNWWMNLRDLIRINTQIYVKIQKKKSRYMREFHYNSDKIIMVTVWSHVLEFSGLIDRPPSHWRRSRIYTSWCLWIGSHSSLVTEHLSDLNCLSWRWLKPNILIWIGRAHICLYQLVSIQLSIWSIRSWAVTA